MTPKTPPIDKESSGPQSGSSRLQGASADRNGHPDQGAGSLKEFVIQAGLEVLDRDGLSLGVESISYAKVFAHLQQEYSIRITRGSVHERIWASHEDFRRDVLAEAVEHIPKKIYPAEVSAFSAALDRLARCDLEASARMAEFARYVGPPIFKSLLETPDFRQLQLTKAMASLASDEYTSTLLRGFIKQRVEGMLSLRSSRFAMVTARMGLKAKANLGLESDATHDLFYTMALNLLVGSYLNYHVGFQDAANPLHFMGVSPQVSEPWTVVSIGIKSLFDFLFEDGDESVDAVRPPPTPQSATSQVATPMEIGEQSGLSRRSREQLRCLVLAAGVELLLRDGLHLRPESLNYATVFSHIKQKYDIVVHRATVHNRFWSSNEEYWLDVMTRGVEVDFDLAPVAVQMLDKYPHVNLPEGLNDRRQAAMDILRVVTTSESEELLNSPTYLRHHSIKSALLSQPESAAMDALRKALHATHLHRIERYSAAIRKHILSLGFEVRPELHIDEGEALRIMALLAVASSTGAIFDQLSGVEAVTRIFRLPREDGSGAFDDWRPTSVATWAYFDQVFRETSPN